LKKTGGKNREVVCILVNSSSVTDLLREENLGEVSATWKEVKTGERAKSSDNNGSVDWRRIFH